MGTLSTTLHLFFLSVCHVHKVATIYVRHREFRYPVAQKTPKNEKNNNTDIKHGKLVCDMAEFGYISCCKNEDIFINYCLSSMQINGNSTIFYKFSCSRDSACHSIFHYKWTYTIKVDHDQSVNQSDNQNFLK